MPFCQHEGTEAENAGSCCTCSNLTSACRGELYPCETDEQLYDGLTTGELLGWLPSLQPFHPWSPNMTSHSLFLKELGPLFASASKEVPKLINAGMFDQVHDPPTGHMCQPYSHLLKLFCNHVYFFGMTLLPG